MEMFFRATKEAYVYPSAMGNLTTQDLWGLSLTKERRSDRTCLDDIAKQLHMEIDRSSEVSFVRTPTTKNDLLVRKLEVVKAVIASKLADKNLAQVEQLKAQKLRKLSGLLADKRDEALKEMSAEELEAQIKALQSA